MNEILPSDCGVGAEVRGVDLGKGLDDASFAEIRDAWHEHLVLLFRGQTIDDQSLVDLGRHFGTLEQAPRSEVSSEFGGYEPSMPEVTIISNIEVNGQPIGSLGAGEADWHADMTFTERPPSACILYALELPPSGGNTMFTSMYRAYETLAPELQQRIEGRRAIHDFSMTSAGDLRKGMKKVTDVRETPGAHQPLVVTHPETGRRALLLGRRRNSYIVGLPVAESEALLDELWAHATSGPFFELVWQLGDLVIWDNRCLMHRRDPFDGTQRRLLHRTQVVGEIPA